MVIIRTDPTGGGTLCFCTSRGRTWKLLLLRGRASSCSDILMIYCLRKKGQSEKLTPDQQQQRCTQYWGALILLTCFWLMVKTCSLKHLSSAIRTKENNKNTNRKKILNHFQFWTSLTVFSSLQRPLRVPGSAPIPLLENNILRFHSWGVEGSRKQHDNCTISAQEEEHRERRQELGCVSEVCYGLFSLQFDAHVTKLWLPYDDDDAFKKKYYRNYCFTWHD